MGYWLGLDVGTTFSAAAIARDGRVEIVSLGHHAATVPTLLLLREDGTFLVGDAAARRGLADPARLARHFKRRFGDSTPLMLGGTPISADALMSQVLRYLVGAVTEQEGAPPDGVAVTYPANWGPYKTDLLRQAVRSAELGEAMLVTEPEAAAVYYASREQVEPGEVVAIYDLGGGTFDAAVLRKTSNGFDLLGQPEGIERLGGIDFDAAVLAHVTGFVGPALAELDMDDPAALAAMARLRADSVEAKEALSADSDVSIPVMLPSLQTEIRLTRGEFEAMIRPTLSETTAALRRALRSSGVDTRDVKAVLLVGGSSRIPLIGQLVSSDVGRPVAIDVHPKHAVALGAALAASGVQDRAGAPADGAQVVAAPPPAVPAEPAAAGAGPAAGPGPAAGAGPAVGPGPAARTGSAPATPATADPPVAPPTRTGPPPGGPAAGGTAATPSRTGRPKGILVAGGVALAVLVIAGAVFAATRKGSTAKPSATSLRPTVTSTAPPSTVARPPMFFNAPAAVRMDTKGNLYVSEHGGNRVQKVSPDGAVTTFAGTGQPGSTGDGGPATAATLAAPADLGLDDAGNLYVVEEGGNRVRKISPTGIITTVVGTGQAGSTGDGGPATAATLNSPIGIAVAPAGALFIGEYGGNRLRKVDKAGIISTLAGNGQPGSTGDNGPSTAATLNGPERVALDGVGDIYVGEWAGNRVRKVASGGRITTVAGTGLPGSTGDGGPATAATLANPTGLAFNAAGDLYVAEGRGNRVRKVAVNGMITTAVGTGEPGSTGDGGPATKATLNGPTGLNFDRLFNLYVTEDCGNSTCGRVRKVTPDGTITTIG